jgi:hypothetical protein
MCYFLSVDDEGVVLLEVLALSSFPTIVFVNDLDLRGCSLMLPREMQCIVGSDFVRGKHPRLE